MQNRKKTGWRLLPALALSLVLFLLLPVPVMAVNPDTLHSLTVSSVASSSEYAEDVAGASVVTDLYQLAAAVPMQGSDGYGYDFLPAYAGITIGDITMADLYSGTVSLTEEQWQELAQQAAQIVRSAGDQAAGIIRLGNPEGQTVSGLDAGLYLIIAHGADIAGYWSEAIDETGKKETVTIAQSGNYTYSFAPAVIALPTKNAASDAPGMPDIRSDGSYGEWIYDASASLKPEMTPRYGGITIVKNIDQFSGDEEVTFVFRITATGEFPDNRQYSYSNVAAISFLPSTGLSSSTVVEGIRAGAEVTVEEIYTGLKYTAGALTPPASTTVTADRTDALVYTVSNSFLSDGPGGHGIQNHFTYESAEKADGTSDTQTGGGRWQVDQQTAASGLGR